ncbi:MAG: hypothetical protein NTZ04_08865 [Chloroflexi bacterium]|nr:hypothetical protein [Chloroflexota bacterium]
MQKDMQVEEWQEYLKSLGLFVVGFGDHLLATGSSTFFTVLAILEYFFKWGGIVPRIVLCVVAALCVAFTVTLVFHSLRKAYSKLKGEKQEQLWLPTSIRLIEERREYLPQLRKILWQMRNQAKKIADNAPIVGISRDIVLEVDRYVWSKESMDTKDNVAGFLHRLRNAMDAKKIGLAQLLKDDGAWSQSVVQLEELRSTRITDELNELVKRCCVWLEGAAYYRLFVRYLTETNLIPTDIHALTAIKSEYWAVEEAVDENLSILNTRIEHLLCGGDDGESGNKV